jgi:hypothetical protein
MLFGEEDARQMRRRFRDRRQFIDPADDLIAEGGVVWPALPSFISRMLFR